MNVTLIRRRGLGIASHGRLFHTSPTSPTLKQRKDRLVILGQSYHPPRYPLFGR